MQIAFWIIYILLNIYQNSGCSDIYVSTCPGEIQGNQGKKQK